MRSERLDRGAAPLSGKMEPSGKRLIPVPVQDHQPIASGDMPDVPVTYHHSKIFFFFKGLQKEPLQGLDDASFVIPSSAFAPVSPDKHFLEVRIMQENLAPRRQKWTPCIDLLDSMLEEMACIDEKNVDVRSNLALSAPIAKFTRDRDVVLADKNSAPIGGHPRRSSISTLTRTDFHSFVTRSDTKVGSPSPAPSSTIRREGTPIASPKIVSK